MNMPLGQAPAPAPTPAPAPGGGSSQGLRGVGRVLLFNLALLALYLVPALVALAYTDGRGSLGEVAAGFAVVVPLGHGFLSMFVGLISLLTGHRDFGAGLMISGPIILVVAFSSCLGAFALMAH